MSQMLLDYARQEQSKAEEESRRRGELLKEVWLTLEDWENDSGEAVDLALRWRIRQVILRLGLGCDWTRQSEAERAAASASGPLPVPEP